MKALYIALLVVAFLCHLGTSYVFEKGSSFAYHVVPTALGGFFFTVIVAYVLWLPVRLIRRKNPPNQLAFCATTILVVSVLAIKLKFMGVDAIQQYEATLAFPFSPKGCAFSAAFPHEPSVRTLSAPGIGDYQQAEAKVADAFVRAECVQLNSKRPPEDAKKMMQAYAEADGFLNPTFTAVTDTSGGLWEMRAYKTVSGTPVTFTFRSFYANQSLMVVAVGGRSADYPPQIEKPFLHGVRLVHPNNAQP